MVKKLVIIFFLFTSPILAEDNCTYKTEQIIENGVVKKVVEYKTCIETENLNKQNFLVNFATKPEFQNTLIIVVMAILENM